ncbi:MAG: SDR family oxidoreductase [Woeseiaceae bacterium]|nr:SDR family oxidoreductase [Woeseiaceae bacterium]
MTANRMSIFTLLALALLVALPGGNAAADAHGAASRPTVLITGANRGLGLEFAKQYAADGWHVIATARKPAQADALNELDVRVLQLDVTDLESVAALAKSLGDAPVDLLINNAGIFPRASTIESVDYEDYMRTLAVNTAGPVLVTSAVLPNLRKGERKKIVNITSRLGSIELNSGNNFYGYRESKAALNMFSKTLAGELGPEGFIVLALHPGWVATDMGGASAPLSPEQSITAMRNVIAGLTPEDSGGYRSYDGKVEPW